MNLSILIDEDLHRSIASVLKALGFMVFDVRDIGMRGQADEYIFKWAQENREVIRLLKDFTEGDYKNALIIVSPNKIRLKSI